MNTRNTKYMAMTMALLTSLFLIGCAGSNTGGSMGGSMEGKMIEQTGPAKDSTMETMDSKTMKTDTGTMENRNMDNSADTMKGSTMQDDMKNTDTMMNGAAPEEMK